MSKRLLDRDKLANYISDNRELLYLFDISCYIPNIEEQLDRIFNPPSAHMDYNAGDLADSYISKYHQFCKTISHLDVSMRDPLDTLAQLANIKHSNMLTWALQEPWRIRWWYFILAFFVGLRLGKVTAEINASLRRTN